MTILRGQAASRGFTLLEVLIALTIVAISSLAILGQTGQSLRQLQQLQARTTAMLVAENQLNALQIMPQWPSLGSNSETLTLADQQWQVLTEVSATSDPWFRKIAVSVGYEEGRQQHTLVELIGYRGLH
jgi:general secretion pathway protein I